MKRTTPKRDGLHCEDFAETLHIQPISQREAISRLADPRCRCGGEKRRKEALCGGCYYALPTWLRRDMYRRLGQGFELAYATAVLWLTDYRQFFTFDLPTPEEP